MNLVFHKIKDKFVISCRGSHKVFILCMQNTLYYGYNLVDVACRGVIFLRWHCKTNESSIKGKLKIQIRPIQMQTLMFVKIILAILVKEEFLLSGVKQYHFGYVTLTTHFAFHNYKHFNEQDSTDIQKIDISSKSRNNKLRTTVFRKPTHTNRLLDHLLHTKLRQSRLWRDEHNWISTRRATYVMKIRYLERVLTRTTTTLTLLNETLTELLNLTRRTGTRHM